MHSANRNDVAALAKEIKEKYPDKTIWLYTGDSWQNILDYAVIPYVDVLVDGEFQMEKRDVTLLWKGSSNQRVIDVQATLQQENKYAPVLHCENHEEIPMGRQTESACDCDSEDAIIPFLYEDVMQKQHA